MSDWNKAIIDEFRANEGKVGGYFKNDKILLLHTHGAKSGAERVNPVVYFEDGDRYVVIASAGGASRHPDWYYNLLAHPEASVEVGTEQFQVVAATTSEPERTTLYEHMETLKHSFTEYKTKTSRVIPVFTLTRKA
jgi:deazaflavin-dependent oxidoreductase (nitroreductase family)